MTRILLILTSTLFFSLTCQAQPVLNGANHNPVAGDNFVPAFLWDTTTVGSAGPNCLWNLRFDTHFPTFLYGPYAGCDPTNSNGSNVYETSSEIYWICDNNRMSGNALGWAEGDSIAYLDPVDLFRYPMTYLSEYTDSFEWVSYGYNNHYKGVTHVKCDAYGTLILSGHIVPDTFTNVLRVHYFDTVTDLNNLSVTTSEHYSWETPGFHRHLARIDLDAQGNVVTELIWLRMPTLADSSANLQLNDIYPNPATDQVNVMFRLPLKETVSVSLSNITGRPVWEEKPRQYGIGQQVLQINTAGLRRGCYFLKLRKGNTVTYDKIDLY